MEGDVGDGGMTEIVCDFSPTRRPGEEGLDFGIGTVKPGLCQDSREPLSRRASENGLSISSSSASPRSLRLVANSEDVRDLDRFDSRADAIALPRRTIASHVAGCCNKASLSCRRTTRPKLWIVNKEITLPAFM